MEGMEEGKERGREKREREKGRKVMKLSKYPLLKSSDTWS